MAWCDFCLSDHNGVVGDADAKPPEKMVDIRDAMAHGAKHNRLTGMGHRCADQYLVYALIVLAQTTHPSVQDRKLALEIVAHYQAIEKWYTTP